MTFQKNKAVMISLILINLLLLLSVLFLLLRGDYFSILTSSMKQTDYDYQSNACYTQRDTQFEMLPKNHVDVVFAGDSITQRFEWQEYFPDLKVANRGIDSDVSLGLLNRVDHITQLSPSKVFLMIGINDLKHNIPNETTIQNYQKIIDELKKSDEARNVCQIYIQSVLPVKQAVGITPEQIQTLNQKLEKLALDNDVTYIDLYTPLLDNQEDFLYTVDGVHPTGEGYQIWMDTISPYVTDGL